MLKQAQAHQPAPGGTRVLYATQGATDPPTFTLFANRRLPPTYLRYLERRLREAFDGHVLVLPRHLGGNTIAIAGTSPIELPAPAALLAAAAKLKDETGLNLTPTVLGLTS